MPWCPMGGQRMEPACWSISWPRNSEKVFEAMPFVLLLHSEQNTPTVTPSSPPSARVVLHTHLMMPFQFDILLRHHFFQVCFRKLCTNRKRAGFQTCGDKLSPDGCSRDPLGSSSELPIARTGVAYFQWTKPLPRRPTTCTRSNVKLSSQSAITCHGVGNGLRGMKCFANGHSIGGVRRTGPKQSLFHRKQDRMRHDRYIVSQILKRRRELSVRTPAV